MQKEGNEDFPYFTKDKFMNDYSPLFSEEDLQKYGNNLKGRINIESCEKKLSKMKIGGWKEDIKEKQIWELEWEEDDYEEDNDTSEEEDEEVDLEEKKTSEILKDLANPKKGFKYFID